MATTAHKLKEEQKPFRKSADILQFKKTKKQVLATEIQATYDNVMLYGGSRSGKTFITIRNIIIRACKVKSRHVVLRLNYNACKKSVWLDTLPKVWEACFLGIGPLESFQNKSDLYVTLPNGSEIWFGGLDNPAKIEKIFGTEYSSMYFNECSQIPYESILDALTRLAENVGLELRAYFDCNPPSKKHWTHKIFVEGVEPDTNQPIEGFKGEYASLVMNPRDNEENLAAAYLRRLQGMPRKRRERFWEGLFGTDIEGALWSTEMIDAALAMEEPEVQIRTVVGVDPAITSEAKSDLWGIAVASIYHGPIEEIYDEDGDYTHDLEMFKGYVHADHSLQASPSNAIKKAIKIYNDYDCDAMIVEVNQGGDMVEDLLHLHGFKGKLVKVSASRGKYARAEPVAALYEQGRIGHAEDLDDLEDEFTSYTPFDPQTKKSPDRLDAVVWALTHLFLGKTDFKWDELNT